MESTPRDNETNSAANAEAVVVEKSGALKRELGLFDVVLAQILMIVGNTWVGTAGKLGAQHAVFWTAAALFFFLPHVLVVIYLNRWLPLEGGLYQWAKVGVNELAGFLVAFDLWLYGVVLMSAIGLEAAQLASYALGPTTSWMREGRAAPIALTFLVIGATAATSAIGLRVGKRVHNTGSVVKIVAYALLLIMPIVALATKRHVEWEPVPVAMPVVTLFSINLLGKMGFGAFSGFEYVAIFNGEAKNARADMGRSVFFTAPIVLMMFVLGTSSVLAFVRGDDIDLIAPIPQVVSLGTEGLGAGRFLATAVSIGFVVTLIGWGAAQFAGVTRLPMVAGWDGLLPAWFSKLHPTRRTPTHSIAFVAAVTIALGVVALVDVEAQEAYQLASNAALVFYALTYLVMFAIPFVGRAPGMPRAPWWLRVACAFGFVMTLLFIVLSVFPIVKVKSDAAFSIKMIALVVGAQIAGVALFVIGKRRRARGENARSVSDRRSA